MKAAPFLLATAVALCGFAQGPIAETAPDEVLYPILFQIVRDLPPPHWDFETKVNWFSSQGFTKEEVVRLVAAANQYFQQADVLNERLAAIGKKWGNGSGSPEAEAERQPIQQQKAQILSEVLASLRTSLGMSGAKLENKIAEMRRNTKQHPLGKTAEAQGSKSVRHH
jgi:hypothetical protein